MSKHALLTDISAAGLSGSYTDLLNKPSALVTSVAGRSGAVVLVEGDVVNLAADLAAKAPSNSPSLTGTVTVPTPVNATDASTKAYVDSAVSSSSADATTTSKGKIQLAGDLAGTAASPALVPVGISGTYGSASTVPTLTTDSKGRVASVSPTAIAIAESQVTGLTSDLSGKEPAVAAGATTQYYRGDKTMQTLNQDVVPDGATNKAYTGSEKTKLAGVATGATANSPDATLLARANHTGTQLASTVSDFSAAADARVAAAAGVSVASLSGGKVPSSQIPAVALVSVQTASSQAAQLALTTQEGDVVVRTDTSVSYMRNSGSTGTMSDFTLLNTPADAVTSVNGYIGVVSLSKGDVGLASVDNTSDAGKPVSVAQAASIAAKADDSSVVHLTGSETVSGAKTLTATTTTQALNPSADITYSLGSGLSNRYQNGYIQRLWMNTGAYIESTANSTIYVGGALNVTAGLRTDATFKCGGPYSTGGTDPLAGYSNGVTATSTSAPMWGFKAMAAQTGDLTRWLSSGGSTVAKVDVNGNITGNNLAGTNTGDQTITLGGDISGTGTNTITATVSKVNGVSISGTPSSGYTPIASSSSAATWSPVPVSSVAGKTGVITLNESDITSLTTDLASKAPVVSPTFTGSVTVPTPSNTTDAATKAYVDGIASAGAPDANSTTNGLVRLAGDLSGSGTTAAAPRVNFANDTLHFLKTGDSLSDGANISVGTTTGSQIATSTAQKLGFFGVTPVTQQSNGTELFTSLSNLGIRASGGAPGITTTGVIQANGPLRTSQIVLTAGATLTAGINLVTQLCDATAGNITLVLGATTSKGYRFTIKKIDSSTNNVTLSASSIDGATTYTLSAPYSHVTVESTGTSGVWYIVG